MPRSSKIFKKKKFTNNQYTPNQQHNTLTAAQEASHAPFVSKSHEKIKSSINDSDYSDFCPDNNNVIVNMGILNKLFSLTVCPKCLSKCLNLMESIELRKGLSSMLELTCTTCDFSSKTYSSPLSANGYDINVKTVYGLRLIGKGTEPAKKLFAIMDMPPPPTKFHEINKKILPFVKDQAIISMKSAGKDAVEKCEINELAISLDGTWQKRGHNSLNGVMSAISIENGKVLDIECLSKYCHACTFKSCSGDCSANYEGSSGGMESAGAKAIFGRSMELHNAKYKYYLGDGDSKAYSTVVSDNVYGPDFKIQKLECIAHVQKQMGSRLRRLKTSRKGISLEDGKKISGKGRLTDNFIDKLQSYYGRAIRDHVNDLEKMRSAVWATFFHISDNHGLCPSGENSWCKANNPHKVLNPQSLLPKAICAEIKPIYRDLANTDLLQKCLHGKTQNANESLNMVIWTRCPKEVFIGKTALQIGVYDAVSSFNDGEIPKVQVLTKMDIKVGENCYNALQKLDDLRIEKAEIKCQKSSKRKRISTVDEEDYGAGMF